MTTRAIVPFGGPVDADVALPGSKSITNRALLCAAMATGTSTIHNVLRADDTDAMKDALGVLGAGIAVDEGSTATVVGVGGALPDATIEAPLRVFANQSGTTARFLAPLLALAPGWSALDAAPQMRGRPMGDLFGALRSLGVDVLAERDGLPAVIGGGPCRGGSVDLAGDVSSQFLSALVLSGPLMSDGLVVRLTTPLVSRPYVAMTAAVASWFGADIVVGADVVEVAPTGYRAAEVTVEPDASAASYFYAAAAICAGRVRVNGLGRDSLQGDVGFAEVLGRMGADVVDTDDGIEVRSSGTLRGIEIDLGDLSDTAPTLGVVAAFADGATTVSGIGFIRAKETDRIGAVVNELKRCGVDAVEDDDGFTVTPSTPHGATVQTYDDHRMAMAFALVGLKTAGIEIDSPDCVAKTFPDYFGQLERLRPGAGDGGRGVLMSDRDLEIVAIDGPAGSGKSTVARAVAERLGLEYLDTGAMYRAVAFAVLMRGVDPGDEARVAAVARTITLDVKPDRVVVDGADATVEIRGPEVTRSVSMVAANSAVREELVSRQREWARRRGGGVLEGRDIGSVVFPEARLKVYLNADSTVRAQRRAKEVADLDYETVAADLAGRDAADQNRTDSPLVEAAGARIIDTTELDVEQVVDAVVALLS